ncbi:BTB/POZ protein [Aspergillus leporis]|uniref:BTB/POZ protein n=1 Tax=Aspergillus leporis TaxID=41062 RepID=A0A5N5WTG6_9EURO|nr:BTB/POZ protein [Aspergillus leporis]
MAEDSSTISPTPAPVDSQQIVLKVGERRFTTTYQTLVGESTFFDSLLSRRWDSQQQDGTYLVDADPALFEHILRYLRRGLFPLFYDRVRGHNYGLYIALLDEARYFGIDKLVSWLEAKEYIHAVKVQISVKVVEEPECFIQKRVSSDIVEEYYPHWVTKRVYVCPRGIEIHRGNPGHCGRRCKGAKGDGGDEYVEEHCLEPFAVVQKKIIFDESRCSRAGAVACGSHPHS